MSDSETSTSTPARPDFAQVKQARAALAGTAIGMAFLLIGPGWVPAYQFAVVVVFAGVAMAAAGRMQHGLTREPQISPGSAMGLATIVLGYMLIDYYFPNLETGQAMAPVAVATGAMLGSMLPSIEAYFDFFALTLLSMVFSAVLDLSPMDALFPWLAIAYLLGLLLRMEGPDVALDNMLLGPLTFVVSVYVVPVDNSDVAWLPVTVTAAVLIACGATLRHTRIPERFKALGVLALLGVAAATIVWTVAP
jgi:hypothetical protein